MTLRYASLLLDYSILPGCPATHSSPREAPEIIFERGWRRGRTGLRTLTWQRLDKVTEGAGWRGLELAVWDHDACALDAAADAVVDEAIGRRLGK